MPTPTEPILDRALDLPALLAPRTTVYEYFGILRDTLVLFEVPAWRQSVKRKPLASSKYYFFDIGVASALQGRRPRPGTPEFGLAFETWLLHELRSWIDYRSGEELSHWRSTSGFEVDFILGDHTAIEVKGKANVSPGDLKALRALAEEEKLRRHLCVCLEPRRRRVGGVDVLPYTEFLAALWSGEYRLRTSPPHRRQSSKTARRIVTTSDAFSSARTN